MSGATPNASKHSQLPPLASRFVEVAALPWEKTRFPGVETKTLLVDRATGVVTSLLKFAPGARLPDHEHVLIEQTFVLEGSLVCGEGECKAGDFVWAARRQPPPGLGRAAGRPDARDVPDSQQILRGRRPRDRRDRARLERSLG